MGQKSRSFQLAQHLITPNFHRPSEKLVAALIVRECGAETIAHKNKEKMEYIHRWDKWRLQTGKLQTTEASPNLHLKLTSKQSYPAKES